MATTLPKMALSRFWIVGQQLATLKGQVAKSGWALYGRVFDARLQPMANFAVFLTDAQKDFQSQFGVAYTDFTGCFVLNCAGGANTQAPGVLAALFVSVANTGGLPVYYGSTPFLPVLGTATYQNITLPAGANPIGSPTP